MSQILPSTTPATVAPAGTPKKAALASFLGSAVDDAEASLWVRDGGPGIPRRDQARIFERFARASDSRRRSEGAGLGLSIVRAIAEAHGGRVMLSSRPGDGATFTVVIPLDGR